MKNKPISNYHTHTYLCKHANGKPVDYVKRAIELNYQEIAITDHGPLIDDILKNFYTRRMSFDQYYKNYLPDLEFAIKKYSSKINILKGLEIEYFENMTNEYEAFLQKLDFLVLGQHYFYIDGVYQNVYNRLTDDEILKYAQTVTQAMQKGYFKIIAHPEIFAYSRDWDEICDQAANQIIASAKQYNVIIEFNVNGIRNSKHKKKVWKTPDGKTNYSYPRREFFELVKKANMPVLISDDAHDPSNLFDEDTKEAYKIVNDIGLKIINKID